MGRVLTNNISLAWAAEQTLGVLPGSPSWFLLEVNNINALGPDITTIERNPISKNRQRRKGLVTDLESKLEFETDFTMSTFLDFVEGFVFSVFKGLTPFRPTAVTATGYTVASGGAIAQNTLIRARGCTLSANNGLKVVGAGSTSTEIKTSGLSAETLAATLNATVEVAGFQGASGDLQIDANGDLISTVLDFTTMASTLTVGQVIHIGDNTNAAYSFATAADYGFARVRTIAANKLTFDKTINTFTVDNGASKTIRILFGRFVRNVAVDHADWLERSFTFEAAYKDLDDPGDMYEYPNGNYSSEMTFNIPTTDKSTINLAYIGTDTPEPTDTRATNADAPKVPTQTEPINSTNDIARLRVTQVDETGLTTDFKSMSITLNNNVSGERVIGKLGPKYINFGTFEVNIETQILFTNPGVVAAIRNNETVTMDFSMRNADGGMFCDIPSLTISGGSRELPENETVLLNSTAHAFQDAELGYSLSFSIFPYLPPNPASPNLV